MFSERLKQIASCVIPFRQIIDVGCDHCYVPIYLVQNDLIDYAIGTDVRTGPILEAQKNILTFGFNDKIEIRLGNGLSTISKHDNSECIIIAGMGGRLIVEILNDGRDVLNFNKRLVLQANIDEDIVRKWLCENHYEIVKEIITLEDNIFYEIIVANKTQLKIPLTDLEIKYGPHLLKDKNALFIKKYQQILSIKKAIIPQIPDYHENKQIIDNEIKEITMILNQL